jgi:hypothetical protein
MFDALKKKLQKMQTPEFSVEVVDKKYKHIRCPTHGQITKHEVNASKTIATPTYCCEELRVLYQAERKAQGSVGGDSHAEVLVQEPEAQADDVKTASPEDGTGG